MIAFLVSFCGHKLLFCGFKEKNLAGLTDECHLISLHSGCLSLCVCGGVIPLLVLGNTALSLNLNLNQACNSRACDHNSSSQRPKLSNKNSSFQSTFEMIVF